VQQQPGGLLAGMGAALLGQAPSNESGRKQKSKKKKKNETDDFEWQEKPNQLQVHE
jgi:hypothetical protein